MHRRSTEDDDAYNHSSELIRSRGKSRLLERRRKHSVQHEEPSHFSICINLGDVSPERVNATITGRTINISGERVELMEETDGMIRRNYQGFSNTFNIPPEVDLDTLNLTICEQHTLLVEAEYLDSIGAIQEYVPKSSQTFSRKSLPRLNTMDPESQDLNSSRTRSSWASVGDRSLLVSTIDSPFQSAHSPSAHGQSSHNPSAHFQSSHNPSAPFQSSHNPSAHFQSSHSPSAHFQSSHNPNAHVQSSHHANSPFQSSQSLNTPLQSFHNPSTQFQSSPQASTPLQSFHNPSTQFQSFPHASTLLPSSQNIGLPFQSSQDISAGSQTYHTAPLYFESTRDMSRMSSRQDSRLHSDIDWRDSERGGSDRRDAKSHHGISRRSIANTENIQKSHHGDRKSASAMPHSRHLRSNRDLSRRALTPTPEMTTETSDSPLLTSDMNTTSETSRMTFSDQATNSESIMTGEHSPECLAQLGRRSRTSTAQPCICPPKQRSPCRQAPAPSISVHRRRRHCPKATKKGNKMKFASFPFCCCPRLL
ncbi:mucin-4-like [Scyliorhinus canicula]|uniref:mucin-4-like n=1 Tax=Scyliorhinus canicula TaxID=7830 RepID=UPI0018F587E0|nr:mucin-4-like [Scyliorhinus canicula]